MAREEVMVARAYVDKHGDFPNAYRKKLRRSNLCRSVGNLNKLEFAESICQQREEEEKLSTYNNMARGLKKHLKRFNAPHHWMLDKLGGAVYALTKQEVLAFDSHPAKHTEVCSLCTNIP
ncbi:hypothetical protein IFM89_008311 [Coptis chinensis]|uniref:Small ribosomal subunit protein eS4 N-terminal domain-containing protein n=1 Tax=Coptis chinensis TaxID=261450 RepID=A0A835M4A6_9MAGN|nr:hypothetical protein IFM89_008311 [Coptis chinensis]